MSVAQWQVRLCPEHGLVQAATCPVATCHLPLGESFTVFRRQPSTWLTKGELRERAGKNRQAVLAALLHAHREQRGWLSVPDLVGELGLATDVVTQAVGLLHTKGFIERQWQKPNRLFYYRLRENVAVALTRAVEAH